MPQKKSIRTLFHNHRRPARERLDWLLKNLTPPEKIGLLMHQSPAIERLGIPEYNWCNEALHGVAHAGQATVFPQAIGLAATWHPALVQKAAAAIGDEARAKHHAFAAKGERGYHVGLNFWSPNVNIFRDPRWGRGQETYGEDPYLTGCMGVAYVRGLQGNNKKYLKCAATPKHYAVHSGPEEGRHGFNSRASLKDIRETYLPAFAACVRAGRAEGIMGAYNRLNGTPCCADPFLLQQVLRDEWGFAGHVVSDCQAIQDIWENHRSVRTPVEAAALALKSGCDLNCGRSYEYLLQALEQGLLTMAELDTAVARVMTTRLKLGVFDPPAQVPYTRIPLSVVDSPAHRQLALRCARESMVLLKNRNSILPLDPKKLKQVLVVGPNADSVEMLLGNYNGINPRMVTPVEGIVRALGPDTAVQFKHGCDIAGDNRKGFGYGTILAEMFDVIIAVLGLSMSVEGEQGVAMHAPDGADRKSLDLPGVQLELLRQLREKSGGKPLVLVTAGGSPITLNAAAGLADAVIHMWYPGEEGGTALADVLFGVYSPSGRLPVTFPSSVDQLPPYEDYSMNGRTYKYMNGEPLYPFGYGLSYTTFRYSHLKLSKKSAAAGQSINISVVVTNTGKCAGDEVVQLYLSDMDASVTVPRWELKAFEKISLKPKQKKNVRFILTPRQMALIDNDGTCRLEPGRFRVYVGGSQPDELSKKLTGSAPLAAEFEVTGEEIKVPF